MPKYAAFRYDESANLGDTIQTLDIEQHLPRVDRYFDRDWLCQVPEGEKYLAVMNGWFTPHPENWPPSEAILPVFYGFHLSSYPRVQRVLLGGESIAYFKRHEPIGCRGRRTQELLAEHGVQAYFSKCLTLTFPRRERAPENGKVVLVDFDPYSTPIPRHLETDAIRTSHILPHVYPEELKRRLAQYHLDLYRDQARLVITSRLHCALPCLAMGVPVIFFGDPHEYRFALLAEFGVQFNRLPGIVARYLYLLPMALKWRFSDRPGIKRLANRLREWARRAFMSRNVNWDPQPVDFEAEKRQMAAQIERAVRARAGG